MKRRNREKIKLTESEIEYLKKISRSRTEKHVTVQRSKIILLDQEDRKNTEIAQLLNIKRQTVEDCLKKCLFLGVESSLVDLPRKGKPSVITIEEKAWISFLACEKPTKFGYSFELWTYTLLLSYIHKNCKDKGYLNLSKLSRSKLHSILNCVEIKPHKITYYLAKKDDNFEEKMAEVLCVYKEVQITNEMLEKEKNENKVLPLDKVTLSYDEKPGIQALQNIAADLKPEPFLYKTNSRDYEYKRHGTLSLLAAIDLHNGKIINHISDTHKSSDFIELLKKAEESYPTNTKIRIILDNHSAHTSKETLAFIATKPNKFEFVFTPKHGSWLNIIEMFFSKMARTFLRGIRVDSKEELKKRIELFLEEVNSSPVIFRWKYKMD